MFKTLVSLAGGPAGVITGWFASFYGKLIGFLAIVAVIGGLGTSVYFSWTHTVRDAERAKLAAAQAQELAKDKDAEIKQLKDLQADKDKAQIDLQTAIQQGSISSDAVRAWIAQQPATEDRPASKILEETFDRLYGKVK